MSKPKRKRPSKGPFVAVPKAIMTTPAWRVMSPETRLLWIELRGWLRNDGLNNGKVLRSCRAAAESIGLSKDTVARGFIELEHYGFVRKTSPGFLGSDGRGIAAKYRFTDLAHGTHAPTRDFEKWDGELFAYSRGGRNYVPRRDRKKQNPVLPEETPCPTGRDIRNPGRGPSVCPTGRDIGAAPNCLFPSDISRLPPHAAGEEGLEGGQASAPGPGADPTPAPDPATCEICGKPGATVAYLGHGMTAVTYRHSDCDKGRRELSAHEHRQAWGIEEWLRDGWRN